MTANTSMSTEQVVQESRALFNFNNWSSGYFDVAPDGRVVFRPPAATVEDVALTELVEKAFAQGLQLPLLIRFNDILTDRVLQICRAFDRAFADFDCSAKHTIAYPIKVNQQRCVVEQIARALPDRVGLEAGSKPELMAVLAQTFNLTQGNNQGTIVCNGYKDREYIRLALIGGLLGKRIFIVVEQPDELDLVLDQARILNTRPLLGVRIRLTSIAKGRWQNSGGEKSKFGLSAAQLLSLLDRLRELGQTDCLKCLHFHIGSQVADIADIDAAMCEAARYYQELHRMGIPVETVDVGGGLGVDYEGSHSVRMFSANYGVADYARSIVAHLTEQCRRHGLPQPEIITECGRALTAHHAVLITEVLDVEQSGGDTGVDITHPLAAEIRQLSTEAEQAGALERVAPILQRCDQYARDIHNQYMQEKLDLAERAGLDALILQVLRVLQETVGETSGTDGIGARINERLADKYFCNFSVFQSTPDVWGIDQVFPIVPLERLNEPLTRQAVIHDLTCDSDGQINRYPVGNTLSATLPVHPPAKNRRDYFGIFMVGAYQEILGDIHNLFGDTHAVNAVLDTEGTVQLQDAEPGDRIDQLLEYLHYDSSQLLSQYRRKLDRSGLSQEEQECYYHELAAGLSGYTYLEE